jgi:hypothetical protein
MRRWMADETGVITGDTAARTMPRIDWRASPTPARAQAAPTATNTPRAKERDRGDTQGRSLAGFPHPV